MGRPLRVTEPGMVYHLMNRRVMRLPIFESNGDYLDFWRILADSLTRPDAPALLAYCLMPNHWHMVVQALAKTKLSTWAQWITVTHVHRWHAFRRQVGEGPLYKGRFKSVPVQDDVHFLTMCRYVEANALRARLVDRAENWRWGSLWLRLSGTDRDRAMLTAWPIEPPVDWVAAVNRVLAESELDEVRGAVRRSSPFGDSVWLEQTASRLGLDSSLRTRGRPRKRCQVEFRPLSPNKNQPDTNAIKLRAIP